MKTPVILFALCGALLAQDAATDAKVKSCIDTYSKSSRAGRLATSDSPQQHAQQALVGLDLAKLSLANLGCLIDAGIPNAAGPEVAAVVRTRLEGLAAEKTADGALAQLRLCQHQSSATQARDAAQAKAATAKRAEELATAFKHPGMKALLATPDCCVPIALVAGLRDAELAANAGILAPVLANVRDDFPCAKTGSLIALNDMVCDPKSGLDEKTRADFRAKVLLAIDRTVADKDCPENVRTFVAKQKVMMNGAAARNELVGFAAPKMNVLWSSGGKELPDLSAFKGKIVLVDFWATWCGPCIGSFPHLREMKEQYKDVPFEILGVTSLQKSVSYPKIKDLAKRRVVDLTPEAEIALMAPWMKDMEMTWPVFITEEDCFNPDYGVRGIPHLALIDATGKVRFNGMSQKHSEMEACINELLKEMGVAAPSKGSKDPEPLKPAPKN